MLTERGFARPGIDPAVVCELAEHAHVLRGAILTMTTLAASGHPGGSMSSLEMYLTLYHHANLRPGEPAWEGRDRVIISHGHTSPGVYCALADAGFYDLEEAVAHFRQAGSIFEGHVERSVPGVEWSSGNLGQGLSAGVGSAIAARLSGGGWHTFVAMSDGEQMKGQVGEARRLARKLGLSDLTAVVDLNGVQISGHTAEIMPVDVAADFIADGWAVSEVDGHDIEELHAAIAAAVADRTRPTAVLAHTLIGKGVSFMEDEPEFHGRGLKADEYARAMAELGLDPAWLERARQRRGEPFRVLPAPRQPCVLAAGEGSPKTYTRDADTDNRSAFGAALVGLAEGNPGAPMAVFDCDLAASVKTEAYAAAHPGSFIECGVGEHNAAAVSGAASVNGLLAIWADFGVFGCDEVYNQQRLNDINGANLKVVLTHCGLDVGEDGKTHQCLDYVAAFRDFFGWKVIVPADPNQTDRAIRAAATTPGPVVVCMGRSKLPVILDEAGQPAFGGERRFQYGAIDVVRSGGDVALLAMGTVAGAAVDAADRLRGEGTPVTVAIVSAPLDLDDATMRALAESARTIVTVEDHSVRTGLGACVAEWLAVAGLSRRFVRLGVSGYRSSGTAADLLRGEGLDADGIANSLRAAIAG